MNYIYGFAHSRNRALELAAVRAKINGHVPKNRNEKSLENELGFIVGQSSDVGCNSGIEQTLLTVIDGNPTWVEPEIANLATSAGHGAALAQAYASHGMQFLDFVVGTFAVAVIDLQKEKTILAVDRLGVRPLCYAIAPNIGLVFANDIDAVRSSRIVEAPVSHQSILQYLYFHVIPSPATIYSQIQKIEPGQVLVFDGNSLQKSFYWQPNFASETDVGSKQLGEKLLKEIEGAVARCSPDSSSGAFLSGGLDSSTVSGLAQMQVEKPFRAYSIGFSQEGYDEIEYARIAAEKFKLDLCEYYVTPSDVADAFDLIVASFGEPFGNSSAIPVYACAKLANQDGVKKLLAGDGGDEIFAGNERYVTQQLFEIYWRLPQAIRKQIVEPIALNFPLDWSYLTRKGKRYIEQARVPLPERLQSYNYLNRYSMDEVFHGEFLKEVDTDGPVKNMDEWYDRGKGLSIVDNMLQFDWKLTLADNDLRKVNRMCEVAGVDVEYPLLDHKLVEFSTQIPANLKIRNRELRYFFKNAMKEFLPNEILTKKKHGFGLPFGEWLKTSDELQSRVLPYLENLKDRKIIRADHIDLLRSQHQNEHAAYFGNTIWVFCVLEKWLDDYS